MPDRYAVIGHPIAHSKSPLIHGLFAQATGQDMTYEAIDGGAAPDGFARRAGLSRCRRARLNVTLPFKLAALQLADEASVDARLAGAANTLVFEARTRGRTTPTAWAWCATSSTTWARRCAAGGCCCWARAAPRAAWCCPSRGRARRASSWPTARPTRRALAHELAPHLGGVALAGCGLDALAGAFDVVVNATSASLGGQAPAVPASAFAPARWPTTWSTARA
jgi:shikimate dehydrogenase